MNLRLQRISLAIFAATVAVFTTQYSSVKQEVGEYNAPAYRPNNPNNVRVKVSLNNMMVVYVMEGNRALLVTPVAIGRPGKETPRGNFTAYKKIEKKRSYTYRLRRSGSASFGDDFASRVSCAHRVPV